MSILLNDNIKLKAGKPVDERYLNSGNTIYSSISEVNARIPISERHLGLTVNVGYDEFWYSTGVTNTDLILKTSASGSTINNAQNVGSGIGIFSGVTDSGIINLRSLVASGNTNITLSGDSIIINSTDSTALNDGILNYNGGSFNPYSAFTSGVTFYYGSIIPTGMTLLNLNARLGVTELNISTGNTLTGVTRSIGDVFWNTNDDTVSIKQTENVTQQVGQEFLIKVKNNTAGQVLNGTVVYITGSVDGRITIEPARGSNLDTDIVDVTVGLTTENIPAGSFGFVTTSGFVNDLNTSGFTLGDTLFLSPTVWGGVTNVEPDYPNYAIQVGFVTNVDPILGSVFVRVKDVSKTRNIKGVEIVSPPFTASTRSEVIFVASPGIITLPATPVLGQEITVSDYDGDIDEGAEVIIDGNGKNIKDETEAIINTNFGSFRLVYNGTRWIAATITP
jgi:hypothetical protein